jgi:thioredoxin 1
MIINVYLDDVRPIPLGFIGARSAEECLEIVREYDVGILSLDFELGLGQPNGLAAVNGIIAEGRYPREVYVHSSSLSGRAQMNEWEPGSWRREWTAARGPLAVFVHTPLCGTCKVARRMLEVVVEMMPGLPLAAANLNAIPELATTFFIESVPCLLIKRSDGGVDKMYRFSSVVEVANRLRPLFGIGEETRKP